MRGKAALWLPGTDHAGIATQMVVERQLAAQGNQGRRELGREAFVAKVWDWKAQSGGAIVQPAAPARRLLRLEPRALHPGRGPVGRRPQGVRHPAQAGPDLPRQAAGELGSRTADRDLGPGGRAARGRRPLLAPGLSLGRRLRRDRGGHHPARDHAGRHGGGRASQRRALHPLVGKLVALRSPAARSRSSPTTTPTPRRARAR